MLYLVFSLVRDTFLSAFNCENHGVAVSVVYVLLLVYDVLTVFLERALRMKSRKIVLEMWEVRVNDGSGCWKVMMWREWGTAVECNRYLGQGHNSRPRS